MTYLEVVHVCASNDSESNKDGEKMTENIKKYLNTDVGIAFFSKRDKRYHIKYGGKMMPLHKAVYLNCFGDTLYGREIHHRDGNRFNNYYLNLVPVSHEIHALLHKYGVHEKREFEIIENTKEDARKDTPLVLTYKKMVKT